jgi:hypothetical protein
MTVRRSFLPGAASIVRCPLDLGIVPLVFATLFNTLHSMLTVVLGVVSRDMFAMGVNPRGTAFFALRS